MATLTKEERSEGFLTLYLRPVDGNWVMGEDEKMEVGLAGPVFAILEKIAQKHGMSPHRIRLRPMGGEKTPLLPQSRYDWKLRRLGLEDFGLYQVEPTIPGGWVWHPMEYYIEKFNNDLVHTIRGYGGCMAVEELAKKIFVPPIVKTSLRVYMRKYPERFQIHCETTTDRVWVREALSLPKRLSSVPSSSTVALVDQDDTGGGELGSDIRRKKRKGEKKLLLSSSAESTSARKEGEGEGGGDDTNALSPSTIKPLDANQEEGQIAAETSEEKKMDGGEGGGEEKTADGGSVEGDMTSEPIPEAIKYDPPPACSTFGRLPTYGGYDVATAAVMKPDGSSLYPPDVEAVLADWEAYAGDSPSLSSLYLPHTHHTYCTYPLISSPLFSSLYLPYLHLPVLILSTNSALTYQLCLNPTFTNLTLTTPLSTGTE